MCGLSLRCPQSRRGPTVHSGDEGPDHTAMASPALAALSSPPPFLATPGTPAIPWTRWICLFENFLLASGATDLPAPRLRALLLHCLGLKDNAFLMRFRSREPRPSYRQPRR
ncbi:hypothetical protein HPB50_028935 [Hyalomma asiaticum]|nr:hypothetical protein HPB50_028935 [Hyalomma asiaticum]